VDKQYWQGTVLVAAGDAVEPTCRSPDGTLPPPLDPSPSTSATPPGPSGASARVRAPASPEARPVAPTAPTAQALAEPPSAPLHPANRAEAPPAEAPRAPPASAVCSWLMGSAASQRSPVTQLRGSATLLVRSCGRAAKLLVAADFSLFRVVALFGPTSVPNTTRGGRPTRSMRKATAKSSGPSMIAHRQKCYAAST